jgi:hypothetical protein
MPKTATPVVFASVVDDSPQNATAGILPSTNSTANTTTVPANMPYMILSDLGGDIYFPIICVYDSETVYPKLFLAKDGETGVATLMSNRPDILRTVTGSAIKQCGYVPLTNGNPGSDVGLLEPEGE